MDEIKKSWSKLAINEKVGLIASVVCLAVMLALLLSSRDAIEKVLPYVLAVGALQFVAGAIFIWRRNKRNALIFGIGMPIMVIAFLVIMYTSSF